MINVLKAKHFNTQQEWMYVWEHFEEFRSFEEIEALVSETVDEILSVCRGHSPAIAWSGGKDSIALEIVCEKAGITNGFCCYNDLYFSESIKFFKNNAPSGVELYNSGEDIPWLSRHPQFLFPKKPHVWNIQTHLKYQPIYCEKKCVDLLLMGKRTQDGNYVSKDIIMSNNKNVNIYCPIRKWTHEDVICAIRYYNKSLSHIYFTDDGFHYGDTKFAVMNPQKGETLNDAWNRIYKIEPRKVIDSAKWGLRGAFEFLESLYDKDCL